MAAKPVAAKLIVSLTLRQALKRADADQQVKGWKAANQGYFVSAYTTTAGTIGSWNINYYTKQKHLAATYNVPPEPQPIKFDGESPLLGRKGDPPELSLKGATGVKTGLSIAAKKLKIGTWSKAIIAVQQPEHRTSPVIICNFITKDLFVQSIWVDLKTKKVIVDKQDKLVGATGLSKAS